MVIIDENFRAAGQKVGIEIWRIKQFAVHPVDKSQYGNFYSGDAYIVLSTKDNQRWDVHFWLGQETSQDERGTAAIKTVELDDALGGGPVQYREVQGHESPLFMSYFKSGVKYLKGGYESGFRHVGDEKIEPRLLHCKGKRNVRVKEVELSRDSLNKGDVFILDMGDDIYVWCPPKSGRLERIKGMQHANNIRDQERAGRGNVHCLDADWDSNGGFWGMFGGFEGVEKIKDAEAGGADEDFWIKKKADVVLWKVSDASGKMQTDKVASGHLNYGSLDSKDAFILDTGNAIFVWVGKGCTMDERKKAMNYAQEYLEIQKRPSFTQVVRVLETAEPSSFNQWFETPAPNRPGFKPHLFQCSDESGKLVVEEVKNYTQDDLDGDDVMILDAGNKIYIWVSRGASDNEKEAAPKIANKFVEVDSVERRGKPDIITIQQGAEPESFKIIFGGTWKSFRK